MPQFADRVKTTSTSTGSSAITLSSSGATGYQAFPSSLDGETVGYVIEASGGTDWEIGTGVYTHSSLNLTRSLRSSSTGSLLNLGSGTHTVFLTPAFQDIQIVEAFSSTSDLPSASDNHGRVYHVHGEGALYFAHSGSWVKLANYSDITTYSNATTSAAGLMSAADKTKLDGIEASADVTDTTNVVAALTAGTNITIAADGTISSTASGGGSSTSALTETTFSASANQTAFPVSGGITNAANVSVFQNGVKLEEGASKDYTASASTNTVTLNSGAAAGDVVEVLEYGQPNSITDLSDTPSSLGTAGQVLQVNSGATALEFADASSGSGVTVYTGLSGTDGTPSGATYLLNASSPSAGDLAYVTANTSLYQNNGNGWYRIAVINTTPTISSVADASSNTTPFTLEGGTNTVITVTASDADEGTDLTYSYSVTSGSLNGTTVTQGTGANENVFTIAPHASNATTFSLTFTVSDSINAATSVAEFTLEFQITDSHYTTLLMATDGSQGDNSTITYDTGSSTGNSLTVNGDAHAGTFSPYRHGGYSTYFDGSGDWLELTGTALGNGNFTVEAWVWLDTLKDYNVIYDDRATGSSATGLALGVTSTGAPYLYTNNGFQITSSQTCTAKTWHHISLVRSSGVITIYLDGTSGGTYSSSANFTDTNLGIGVARTYTVTSQFGGYIRDVRAVVGSAITPPSGGPTEPLTAITNTSLLTCHLPYIADTPPSGGTAKTITVSGDPETKPFGPYDYAEYSANTNGGSVYFDGSGDYLTVSQDTSLELNGDFTIEGWVYISPSAGSGYTPFFAARSSSTADRFGLAWGNSGFSYDLLLLGPTSTVVYRANVQRTSYIGQWMHFALVRISNVNKVYVDGTAVTLDGNPSVTDSSTVGASDWYIGYNSNLGGYLDGYISNFRVIKGTGLYTSDFTPPTAPLTAITNTSLLLSGTDAHVLDKSQVSNLKLEGGAAASTTQAKFSNTASVYFDGNGDYVSVSDLGLSGDITIEGWFYQSVAQSATYRCALGASSYSTNGNPLRIYTYNSIYSIWLANTGGPHISGSFTANTWHHVALVRSSGTWTLYIDGTSAGTSTTNGTYNFASTVDWTIGADAANTYPFTGYIQDLRITKGLARYTAADESSNIPSAPLKG